MSLRVALIVLASLAALPAPSGAHPLAPSSLRLRALDDGGRFEVRWRTPSVRPVGAALAPRLPERCRATGARSRSVVAGRAAVEEVWQIDCGSSLVGARIEVAGLERSSTNVIVEVVDAGGHLTRGLLHRGAPAYVVPESQGTAEVVGAYLSLGVSHLVGGPDHVLFVLGLLLLIRRWRRLAAAITSFTAGHSVSLALAALGVVRAPAALVEVAIAVTLLVLALDVLRAARGEPRGPIARWPWAVCGLFGLLHGLGFASALSETGLAEGSIPLSLFAFNVGIELGQLGIVALALLGWRILRRAVPRRLLERRALPAYVLGAFAASWVIERSLGAVGVLRL